MKQCCDFHSSMGNPRCNDIQSKSAASIAVARPLSGLPMLGTFLLETRIVRAEYTKLYPRPQPELWGQKSVTVQRATYLGNPLGRKGTVPVREPFAKWRF